MLFTVLAKSGTVDDAAIAVLSLRSRARRVLLRGGASAQYAPTGHLVALTRLTHEGANHRPVLSPDGRYMVFSRATAGHAPS